MTKRIKRPVPIERHGFLKRGQPNPPEYTAWYQMVYRCTNKSCPHWENYGGRGITVCSEWRYSFTTFLRDVGPRPSRDYSLDRIDNNRGYEPSNVRWADRRTQNNNTRRSRRVLFQGSEVSIADLSRATGVPVTTLRHRILKQGLAPEDAVT